MPFLRADQREDLGVGVEVDAVPRLAEGRDRPPQLGSSLVEGVLVERRVLDVVLEARMIGAGVGRSGSPTPRLMTSRPAAMAAFFFLSISAKR